jgi:DNA gyrase subunit B
LTIELDYNGEKTTYYSQNGLNDLVDGIVKDKEAISNRFQMNFENGKNKMDMVMTYVSSYSSIMIPYVNTGLTEKGPHITQIKTLLTREFNKFFREKNWLKEKDANLSGEDIQEGLCVVFNITASNVSYNAQVKSTITKIDMAPFTTALTENLQDWLKVNEKEVKIIADKALSARKAREAAKKAREAARAPKEKGLKAKMALSDKFIDCVSKSPKERKLFLLEGLSAGAAAVEARNPKTDCIYLLRGKIISPLKNDTTKILANQEMSDLVKIIGGGFGADFDLSKCNFDKIVIFSDSDSDGDQICLLLMGFFYTYMRPLVEAGKLYRGAAPLYTVKQGKEERYFYTDKEYRDWFSTATGKFSVLRGKGVGELEATDLHRLCFATERFKRLCVSDLEQTTKMLDIFLGTAVVPRRNYIYDNAEDLGFNME